ncbi:VOC family protein [Pseudarthrobacter sp. MDT1-22]
MIHLVWTPGIVLDAVDARAAMAGVNEVAGGQEYPMLVDVESIEAVTRQARAVLGAGPKRAAASSAAVKYSPAMLSQRSTLAIVAIGLILSATFPRNGPQPPDRVGLDHLSFAVSARTDLDTAVTVLDELGIAHGEVKDIGAGYILEFRDPDNVALELFAPA